MSHNHKDGGSIPPSPIPKGRRRTIPARSYTDQERRHLERLVAERKSSKEIALILGRTNSSVRSELKRGGGINKYSAEKLISSINKFKANRGENISASLKCVAKMKELEKTVLDMQQQIDHIDERFFDIGASQKKSFSSCNCEKRIEFLENQIDEILTLLLENINGKNN